MKLRDLMGSISNKTTYGKLRFKSLRIFSNWETSLHKDHKVVEKYSSCAVEKFNPCTILLKILVKNLQTIKLKAQLGNFWSQLQWELNLFATVKFFGLRFVTLKTGQPDAHIVWCCYYFRVSCPCVVKLLWSCDISFFWITVPIYFSLISN